MKIGYINTECARVLVRNGLGVLLVDLQGTWLYLGNNRITSGNVQGNVLHPLCLSRNRLIWDIFRHG